MAAAMTVGSAEELPHPTRATVAGSGDRRSSGSLGDCSFLSDLKVPASLTAGGSGTGLRGRAAVLRQIEEPHCGVSQKPSRDGGQSRADAEEAARRDVAVVVATYKASGFQFSDPDLAGEGFQTHGFPPTVLWRRAGEAGVDPLVGKGVSSPCPSNLVADAFFLGAVQCLLADGHDPRRNIVAYDHQVGVYGVLFRKDGCWVHEVVDDLLPYTESGHLAVGRTTDPDEVWIAIIAKAYAKLHGSFDTFASAHEVEALEDLTGGVAERMDLRRWPIWGDLWEHLRQRRALGAYHVAIQRTPRRAAYGCLSLAMQGGEMRVELSDCWSAPQRVTQWVPIADFARRFGEVVEVRICAQMFEGVVVDSIAAPVLSERPSRFILAGRPAHVREGPTPAVLVVSQPDRRWTRHDAYSKCVGVAVYRARAEEKDDPRQRVSESPFDGLELILMATASSHTVVVDLFMEPRCLYVATVLAEDAFGVRSSLPRCCLRWYAGAPFTLRELSQRNEVQFFIRALENVVDARGRPSTFPPVLLPSPTDTGTESAADAPLGGRAEQAALAARSFFESLPARLGELRLDQQVASFFGLKKGVAMCFSGDVAPRRRRMRSGSVETLDGEYDEEYT